MPRLTTVKPWTSLDIAKPTWEDSDQQGSKVGNYYETPTYGLWNKDNLKLDAVPFSRATDGKERKWILMNSTTRKKKIIIPNNARHLVINDSLGLQVVPKQS